MRVTSNLFPENFKMQLQDLQQKQLDFQKEIATGLKLYRSSQDPVNFQFAQQNAEHRTQSTAFLNATESAQITAQSAHSALNDLMLTINRAYEVGIRGTNIYGSSQLKAMGEEMKGLVSQLATIVNRVQDGNLLFGSTSNVAPVIVTPGNPSDSYAYDPGVINNVRSAQISKQADIETTFVLGVPDAIAGAGNGFSGVFVSNPTASTNPAAPDPDSDILTAMVALRDSLLSGTPTAPTDNQMIALKAATDRITEFVGRSAGRLSGFEINRASMREAIVANTDRVSNLTEASLADSIANLQKVQLHYQGALQSGAQILNISLLDFVR